MKHTTLLLTTMLSVLLFASCEKKGAPQAQPPAQADTPTPADVAESAAPAQPAEEPAPATFDILELTEDITGRFTSSDGSEIPIRRTPFDEADVIVRELRGEFEVVEEAFRIPNGMAFNSGSAYRLTGMTKEKSVLNGISDYWYRVDISLMALAGEFWVFGGYVSFDGEPPLPAAYGEKSRPTDALDIVFADGTATAWREGLTLTQAQKEAAVAVIFYRGTECSDDGRERLLGVGLTHEKDGRAWCTDEANAYRMNIDTIQCRASGEEGSLTFEGDLDGSDNLSQIGAYLAAHGSEDDTADAQKYPAFHYAKNYAAQPHSRVAGTPFADGWYLPALAELFQLWKRWKPMNMAIEKCGGDVLETGERARQRTDWLGSYLSSSQSAVGDSVAYLLGFYDGDWYGYDKDYIFHTVCAVCAVRDFTERTDFSGDTPAPAECGTMGETQEDTQ